jgi:integrase
MYDAGMRNEEAVALRWEHINFDKSIIFNPRVKAEDTDGWVPLSERLKEALLARNRGQKHGWVFHSKRSSTGHLCLNVSRPLASARNSGGLSADLVPYSARHTFGTAMLEMTGDVVFVGKLMGHKNPLTTTRYLHPSLHRAKELIDRRNREAEEFLRHIPRHTEEISESSIPA